MSTGTPPPDAVFLVPNEYQTISTIGRTKKNRYQTIDGKASENDGARSRRLRGGPATGTVVVISSPTRSRSRRQAPAAAFILL